MKILIPFLILTLISCSKKDEFLFIEEDPKPRLVTVEHNMKQRFGSVDILWVIDNSGSMNSHHNNVKTHAERFMSAFLNKSDVDFDEEIFWRMGLISSDENQAPFLGFPSFNGDYFDNTSKEPVLKFKNAVNDLGTDGSATERFYSPTLEALQIDSFIRPNAFLAIIFVSDEKEQSVEKDEFGNEIKKNNRKVPTNVRDFYMSLLQLKGNNPDLILPYVAHTARDIAPTSVAAGCSLSSDLYFNSRWEELMNYSNGRYFSLCESDFGDTMAKVGREIFDRLTRRRILLPDRPKEETIKVIYEGEELPGGQSIVDAVWYYDDKNNEVVFFNLDFTKINNVEDIKVTYEKANGF